MNDYDIFLKIVRYCIEFNDVILMEDLVSSLKKRSFLYYKILDGVNLIGEKFGIYSEDEDYELMDDFIIEMFNYLKNDDLDSMRIVINNAYKKIGFENIVDPEDEPTYNFDAFIEEVIDPDDFEGNLNIVMSVNDDALKAEIIRIVGTRRFLITCLEFINDVEVKADICHYFGYRVSTDLYPDAPFLLVLK